MVARSGSSTGLIRLVAWSVAVAAGTFLGYTIGVGWGSTGLAPFVNAAVAVDLATLILLVLTVLAVITALRSGGRGRPATRGLILAALAFVVGLALGWGLSVAFGPHKPVVLEASGTVGLALPELEGYVDRPEAAATCRSEVDSQAVALIVAPNVGTVEPNLVRVQLSTFPAYPGSEPEIQVWILASLDDPGAVAGWSGSATFVEGAVGAATGKVGFSDLVLHPGLDGTQPAAWPPALSGTLAWSCAAWNS